MLESTSLCKTRHLSQKTAYSCTSAEGTCFALCLKSCVKDRQTRNDKKTKGGMHGNSLKGNILSHKIILKIGKGNILSNVQVVPLAKVLEVTEP